MTRKLLKTVAIVVIALAPLIAAGSTEAHGGGFHGGAFTAAVSVAEALVTGASEATDFGLVGFSEASIPATMAAITLAITDTASAI
jgi:hypothetical protein